MAIASPGDVASIVGPDALRTKLCLKVGLSSYWLCHTFSPITYEYWGTFYPLSLHASVILALTWPDSAALQQLFENYSYLSYVALFR